MDALLREIEQYWTRRAESYSEVVQYEMAHENEDNWMRVIEENLPRSRAVKLLDIGTGPGFFAIGLAKRGYDVTAVDYTQAMLDEAMRNAGPYRDKIRFLRMDAHSLDFADNTFDAIVTRNLTWNLERPQDAYNDWCRVLKPGGILLNFDAGWYTYLFDAQKEAAFQEDRAHVAALGIIDHNAYCESDLMENISRNLILSRSERPGADVQMLDRAGFRSVRADTEVWKRTWDDVEKVNFASTPLFMLCAQK